MELGKACALLVAVFASGAHAQTFVELSGHWNKADSAGVFGTVLGDRADLTSAGAYVGMAHQFHPNIGMEVGYDYKAVEALDKLSSDYHKTNAVSAGVKFNSTGPWQGFIRLGARVHMTQEQVQGVSASQTAVSAWVAPGVAYTEAGGPRISLWGMMSVIRSPITEDLFRYTQIGLTVGIPID